MRVEEIIGLILRIKEAFELKVHVMEEQGLQMREVPFFFLFFGYEKRGRYLRRGQVKL